MPDRAGHPFHEAMWTASVPGPEAARVRSAAARVQALERIERRLLELAVRADDDTEARWLEWWADAAWRDARALRAEHDDGRWPPEPA